MLHLPFSTRDPYPSWYRRSPVAVFMPWRNLGCLGVKCFGLYADVYPTWHFPWLGLFFNVRGHRAYPIAAAKRRYRKTRCYKWFSSIYQDMASNLAGLYWEQQPEPITRWQTVRAWCASFVMHLRFAIGGVICRRFGHSHNTDVEEFVSAERDERGRITDIDGGGVDWFCPRCGQGGRSWW